MNLRYILYRSVMVLLKILLGCVLACSIALFFASRSEVVHQEIKRSVQNMFKNDFDCHWEGELASIDLLSLDIKFRHVTIMPSNSHHGWSLYADNFHIFSSWGHFLWTGIFSCHSFFEQVVVHEEQRDGKSYFYETLSKMLSGEIAGPFSFDFIAIQQGQFIVQDSSGDIHVNYEYNFEMSRDSDGIHTKLYTIDGNFEYKGIKIIENFFGNCMFVFPYDHDLRKIYARVDCRLSIPQLQEKGACFLKGDIYESRGACIISNDDQSFIIEPLKFRLKEHAIPVTCSITIATELLQLLVVDEVVIPDLSGNATLTVMGNLLDVSSGLQGKLQVQNIAYKNNTLLERAFLTFYKEKIGYATKLFVGSTCVFYGTSTPTETSWKLDAINSVQLSPWWTSYWKMPEKKGMITAQLTKSLDNLQGSYNFSLESIKLDEQAHIKGSFTCDAEQITLQGNFLDQKFESIVAFAPTPHLISLKYYTKDETFLDFHEDDQELDKTVGFLGFNCIKNMLPDEYKSSFSQPGKIDMSGYLHQGTYFADVQTHDAHIRIPSLYNVMQSFKAAAQLNFMDKSLSVQNLVANLYEGKIYCDHAVAQLDSQSKLTFLHAPMFLDSVLISWYKGIFGVLSGRIFLSLRDDKDPVLQGNLILDKTQLQGNIFSAEFQDHLLGSLNSSQPRQENCDLDISIQTKDPITIETSFLQATAHLDFHITNNVKQPEVAGTIDIVAGELKFPYKSLFITHGHVLIMPKNSSEPMLEFVAKGKIKRYNITMRATGTVMDQQIHFDSSPHLSEEQIISLLLIGSQDSSLSAVMPAMFMQKLHEIIFGPAISKSKLDIIFNRLLQSFKNVRIYPQFTNQTGRGGVRGVIEIDATDRLHGRIDSNLMQLEDTIFEADYALTDDVTVRAIKDGPSTYGGEVEMRWKFS
ncbi:translocation/assembly module TamB domain-containing protein [Candidatus Chromulinivorax destructor]|uniref:Translocation and assembly module TamB C-terminal domain-containing protein n=1 Tax=Candidatus Chromulinivorax destructor TaxID=2066483 RepID=A0A345ZBK8_9BACT|nr:translocation/assembly module TamB domain-containing protein [Candidatus Chromulinivorax destructor]AXK60675.1 hypothetical protein C0J27_02885 [Candidatus Chromulinivorax destructor]